MPPRSRLLLKSQSAEFPKLYGQTVPQRTLWTQVIEQCFGFGARLLGEFAASEQFSPASGNLLFGEQS